MAGGKITKSIEPQNKIIDLKRWDLAPIDVNKNDFIKMPKVPKPEIPFTKMNMKEKIVYLSYF